MSDYRNEVYEHIRKQNKAETFEMYLMQQYVVVKYYPIQYIVVIIRIKCLKLFGASCMEIIERRF